MLFSSVMVFQVVGLFRQSAFDHLNKIAATCRHAAHAQDGFAFGVVVRDSQYLAKASEPVCCSLDHLVGCLAPGRIQHFYFALNSSSLRAASGR